jgi:predicted phage-related endonuclease
MDRTKHIGGSDIGSVVNAPPYGCARKLWYQKRGIEPDYAIEFKGHLIRGTKLEPLIVEEYTAKTGNTVRRRKTIQGEKDYEIGQPDRIILNDPRGPGILETKSANERNFRKFQKEGLPLSYQLQIQWYMGHAGYKWGAFAILEPSNWRFDHFEVHFDASAFDLVREMVAQFWAMVQGEGEPDRLPVSDKRCQSCEWRHSCQGVALLESVDADDTDAEIPALADLAQEYLQLREVRDEAEDAMDSVKAEAMGLLGDRAGAMAPGFRVLCKPQTSMRVDSKALKAKFPDVYEAVVKPSVSRPFRVFPA